MGTKFEIIAAHYPFKGYYEASFQCETVWAAFRQFRKYKSQGYEIIDLCYRDIKERITWAFDPEE